MRNFDWKTFLKRHPIFKSLDDKDIEQIVKDNVSEERDCAKGSVIIREGEFSDSVFLIGTGSVQVVLQGKDGYEINISTLGKGEFFGEMAPVERIRRTATVIARENSTLLEVNGEKFCDIMRKNHIVAFNVLLKLSERLRHVSEHVLAVKLKDADEKIDLFNTKLDAELKTVEAHLKASLTVFEQTNTRTSEVISSAERSRTRLTTFGSALGGVITVAIALFSWFGFQELKTIKTAREEIDKIKVGINTDIDTVKNEINTAKNDIDGLSKEATAARDKAVIDAKNVETINIDLSKTYGIIKEQFPKTVFMPLFDIKLENGNYSEAFDFYTLIQELSPQESELRFDLLFKISLKVSKISNPNEWVQFSPYLEEITKNANTPVDKISSYYVLLTNGILLIDEKLDTAFYSNYDAVKKFETFFSNFKKYLKALKERQRIEDKKEDLRGNLSAFKSIFDRVFNEMEDKDTKKKSLYKDLNKLLEEEGMLEINNGV